MSRLGRNGCLKMKLRNEFIEMCRGVMRMHYRQGGYEGDDLTNGRKSEFLRT